MIRVQNFINGLFTDPADGEYINSFDPSTGEVWAQIPDSGTSDVNEAVESANKALESWSKTSVNTRSDILLRIADLIEARLDEFAIAESRDQGKPIWLAKSMDIPRAIYNFRCFATSILHTVEKSTFLDSVNALNYTSRDPVGVAVLISPWNLPLYLLTFKMAPAIACGNTVVCKPSEMTSVTAWMLCDILQQAGVPAGVVNVVFGTGPRVGQALVEHPGTHLVSFTGSTLTAERIRLASASSCKKLSLELGGKNPAIVFNDADLSKCISTTIRSSFLNQGEICLCTSRIYVQADIFDEFLEQFVKATRDLTVGDPRNNSSWMGALISSEHRDKVLSYIKLAHTEGSEILCGHGLDPLHLDDRNQQGYFVRPTVITKVSKDSRLICDEIFGPVVCVVPFSTEQQVLELANSVKYGLCATVWSTNVNTVHRVARQLQVGTVWANSWLIRDLHMPFGGVKSSGTGREGVTESLEFYTEVKAICIQLS